MISKFRFFAILLLVFFSCSEDDTKNCLRYETDKVQSVDSPDTGKVNEQVKIQVSYSAQNACGQFEKFMETGSDFSRRIQPVTRYEGCVCAEYLKPITTTYKFTPGAPGEYELSFPTGYGDPITINLHILE